MPKKLKIPKLDELPDIFDLVLAGQLLGYNEDYLRKQSIAGRFPGYQLFPGKGAAWRVNKTDLLEWLDMRRSESAWVKKKNNALIIKGV